MHGLATSAGRYQYGSDYIRFYVFTCWIVWSILFFIMINPTKVRVIACFILILYVITSSIYKIENKASDKNRYTKADINILNGSFHHMAYFRMNLPHIIFDYNPIAHYDTYLKEKKWGMYHDQSYPDISKINRDICVAEKKHSFIVSEKKFYEQILTGWNISRNKYLKNIYAFDQDKRLVAIGKSMPQSDTIVPTRLLSKDKIQIYLIIPMEYPLRNITLLGGDDKNLCLIKLDSSINKSYVE